MRRKAPLLTHNVDPGRGLHYMQIVQKLAAADGIPFAHARKLYAAERERWGKIADKAHRMHLQLNRGDSWNAVRGLLQHGTKGPHTVRGWLARFGVKGETLGRLKTLERELRDAKSAGAARYLAALIAAAPASFKKGKGVDPALKAAAKAILKRWGLDPGLFFTLFRAIYA